MTGLFDDDPETESALADAAPDAPLAERMRPRSLDEVAGQDHLLTDGGVLRTMLDHGLQQSLILWGPPGVGKTTLARLVAAASDAARRAGFARLSVISAVGTRGYYRARGFRDGVLYQHRSLA